jgi:hypothetical protein
VNVYEAADFVQSLALKPGWKIEEVIPMAPNMLGVVVSLNVANSNERYAPDYRGDTFTAQTINLIPVTGLSKTELCGKVIKICLEKEAHEWREFARYQDGQRWVAPFHPHQEQGERNWLTGMARPDLVSTEL